jgi:arginine-tRNA-protein transferase
MDQFITTKKIRLVKTWPPTKEYLATIKEEHALYAKYQMKIHHDTEKKCSFSQFKGFLCESPLSSTKYIADNNASNIDYGSYHQQYRINGKLVAVGVIDILSNCVSSVYFFYDPDYQFLNLGTYSALKYA